MRFRGKIREYRVIGSKRPTESEPKPPPFHMEIFAPNEVVAKSRFWYYCTKLKKIKKTQGVILQCVNIAPKKPLTVKNFGIWIRYDSRSGTHNMYREFRDLTRVGAITTCYREMAARHRARPHSIHIRKIEEIKASKCRRPHVKQFHNSKIKFPLPQ
ncbi:eL20 family ribosomal protein, partial [Salmonella sp. s51228]|uniref:eL20 family ribosomal protein n=1 Tax=Salmonella sp. s51228 TaxID=3159652 RepID=UPI00398148DC